MFDYYRLVPISCDSVKRHMVRSQTTALLCAYCCAEIRFEEGDVIFGEAWFHRDCAPKFRLSSRDQS